MSPERSAKVDFYEAEDGEWRYRVKAANGEPVLEPGEGHRDLTDAVRAFRSAVAAAIEALARLEAELAESHEADELDAE